MGFNFKTKIFQTFKFFKDVVEEMSQIAPMLQVLGYDPNANPPNYGQPDEIVLKKTQDLHVNSEKWYKKAVEMVNDPSRVELPNEDNAFVVSDKNKSKKSMIVSNDLPVIPLDRKNAV